MSHYKYSFCVLLIICLFPFCKEKNPVDICSGFENKVYEYSIYDCAEADSLDCYQKRLKSVLLPEQYLFCSSTDSLARTCLNYPFLPNIWLYNSLQQGFEDVKDVFNGFDELFKRENANAELMKIYEGMNPENVNTISDPVSRGAFMSQFTFIEIVLAQYQLIDKLDKEEGETLINLCLDKYNIKSSNLSYTSVGRMSILAIIARILYISNYEPFVTLIPVNPNLEYFIQSADFYGLNSEIINEITRIIISNAYSYISGLN